MFVPRSYVVISDIHLGLRSNPASEIIDNLYTFFGHFSDDAPISKVRAVFFGGDIWHQELGVSSQVLHSFIPFWYALLKWALRNKIAIRVLKGTPYHDRDQDETFAILVKAVSPELDYKYIPDLSIEYMEALQMYVGYVPDECRSSAKKTEEDFAKLMVELGIPTVDIAIMHGIFEHQLGNIPHSHKVFDNTFWLNHVSGYINIGHVHSASRRGRILAQGSFDRGSHGDETPKGAYYLVEETPGEWAPVFIENKGAKQYRTIKVEGDTENTLAMLEKAVEKIPRGSHLRLSGLSTHPLIKNLEFLKKKFPGFTWTKDPISPEEKISKKAVASDSPYRACSLTRETIISAIIEEVGSISELPLTQKDTLIGLLEGLRD